MKCGSIYLWREDEQLILPCKERESKGRDVEKVAILKTLIYFTEQKENRRSRACRQPGGNREDASSLLNKISCFRYGRPWDWVHVKMFEIFWKDRVFASSARKEDKFVFRKIFHELDDEFEEEEDIGIPSHAELSMCM